MRELPPGTWVSAEGREVWIAFRRSTRARRLTLRFLPKGFELVFPPRASHKAGMSFLETHRAWIGKQESKAQGGGSGFVFIDGERCQIEPGDRLVLSPESSRVQLGEGGIAELEALLRRRAARSLEESLIRWAAEMDESVEAWSLRNQVSRWGSCSSRRSISLNWRLIMCSTSVRDYVVIHELAHLKHMHHGPEFWHRVAQFDGNHRQHRHWLRVHGHEILAWNRGGALSRPPRQPVLDLT